MLMRGGRTGAILAAAFILATAAAGPCAAEASGSSTAASQTAAAPVAWRARVGYDATHPTYGLATLRVAGTGTGSVELGLVRLPPSTRVTVAVRRGTCAKPGSTVVKLPSIVTSSTGGAIRTATLSKSQATAVRAVLKGTGKAAVRVDWPGGKGCGPVEPVVEQSGFLTRQGTELTLNGRPFHELSVNKYDLLQQFTVAPNEAWGDNGHFPVMRAEEALSWLDAQGFRIVRTSASPYYADWFETAFFDADPARQAQKRREFFAGFDQALDACDRHGVRLVASLLWNIGTLGKLGGQSLRATMTDPTSLGRRRVAEFVRAVVTRYRDRPTIAMWEVGNEYNLVADIQWAQFDVTSDQVAAYVHDVGTLIRSIDPNHPITTGDSAPRPAAMHLLRAVRAGKEVDWTLDSADELIEYLRLMNADPIDVISIHYYDDAMVLFGGAIGSPEGLRFYARAAQALEKPLLVGEIGFDRDVQRYASDWAIGPREPPFPPSRS